MIFDRIKTLAQVVGFVCIGLLAVYGALAIFDGGELVLATGNVEMNTGPTDPLPPPAEGMSILGWDNSTVPLVMNYQGELKDPEGAPLTGYYTITFRIYTDTVALLSDALWSETHESVTVRSGHFSVLLGNIDTVGNSLPKDLFSSPDRFIGVTVHPYDEMIPRQRFASVPYAFHADDGVPSGAIIIWTSTDGTCPLGYTRVSSLDGQFLRGALTYGATGGSATHNHSNTGFAGEHNHYFDVMTDWEYGGFSAQSGPQPDLTYQHDHRVTGYTQAGGAHTHSTSDASNIPPYTNVVFCRRN